MKKSKLKNLCKNSNFKDLTILLTIPLTILFF